jgi:hypothetical protein
LVGTALHFLVGIHNGRAAGAECLAAAVRYRALGWSPLCLCPPDHLGVGREHTRTCEHPGKVPWPGGGRWKEYQTTPVSGQELHNWWRLLPNANVGLALGPVSGLIGVDIEGEQGEARLQEMACGDLPVTLEFTTGNGRRLLYGIPPGTVLRTTPEKTSDGEVRFQAKGAQTVAPPSRHKSGKRYAWVPGRGPDEIRAAEAPAWLVAHLSAKARKGSTASTGQQALPLDGEVIPRGVRDDTLISMAGAMRRVGFEEAEILAALEVTNGRCDPPVSDAQVRKVARSAAGYEPDPGATTTVFSSASAGAAGAAGAPTPPAPAPPTRFADIFTAPELLALDLPEPRWAVEGVVPEGLTLLAGKPKLGKSWLALGLAVAVASGGVALGKLDVKAGDVLYLALEDTVRRLKNRLEKLLGCQQATPPDRLTLSCLWPRQGEGGLEALGAWLIMHPGTARLVIVDTWPRFRPRSRTHNRDLYTEDYAGAAELKAVTTRPGRRTPETLF